ncbi:MAG: hypothetical protein ACK4ND_08645 [Cytophagaceae bacterium]
MGTKKTRGSAGADARRGAEGKSRCSIGKQILTLTVFARLSMGFSVGKAVAIHWNRATVPSTPDSSFPDQSFNAEVRSICRTLFEKILPSSG